jgi:hypothetical protein
MTLICPERLSNGVAVLSCQLESNCHPRVLAVVQATCFTHHVTLMLVILNLIRNLADDEVRALLAGARGQQLALPHQTGHELCELL